MLLLNYKNYLLKINNKFCIKNKFYKILKLLFFIDLRALLTTKIIVQYK